MDELSEQQRALVEISAAYKSVAASPEGQIVIADLVRRFGFSRQTTFDTDLGKMAWKEGGRTVLVHIGRMVDMDTSQLIETTAPRGEQ